MRSEWWRRFASARVKGFWNFAPLDLKVPDGTSVVNVHLDEGLEILSFRMLRELA